MGEPKEPWNINIHYDRLLARLATPGTRVLDVGCGDGFLAARLAEKGCDVVAVDVDSSVLGRAQRRWDGYPVTWIHADLLSASLPAQGFDAVLSNATLHQLPDARAALEALRRLTRPGGVLGVIGFACNGPLDWPRSLVGSVGIFVAVRLRHKWEHTAPTTWPPSLTYAEVRKVSAEVLPQRSFQRLWLGRYFLSWTRPDGLG